MALAVVTGASGFVGSHLVEGLLDRGVQVRCLLRASSSTRWLPQDRVEIARGSLQDSAFLRSSLEGAETFYHVAGAVWAPKEEDYVLGNVTAAETIARAVQDSAPGLRRLVVVSSLAAAGPSAAGSPRTEAQPEAPTSPYGRSKLAGERSLLSILGNRATVIRPPAVLGPRDVGFLKLYRLVKGGLVPDVGRRGQEISLIHVSDLVRGIADAAESPAAAGRIYFLSDPEITTFLEVGRVAARALGRTPRRIRVPDTALVPISRILQFLMPLFGAPNPFPPDRVRDLLQPAWTCSPAKAEKDFGFKTRIPRDEGIIDAVLWCRDQGWLS